MYTEEFKQIQQERSINTPIDKEIENIFMWEHQ